MIKFVLKPGFYEKKRTGKSQPGLDLWRVTLDTLVDRSLVVTTDCCNYYPTAPLISAVDYTDVTEEDMDAANVPLFGMFITSNSDNTDNYIWMRQATGDVPLIIASS